MRNRASPLHKPLSDSDHKELKPGLFEKTGAGGELDR